MKNLLFLILLVFVFSFAVSAQTEIITVFEAVKIKNDKRAEALFYYENNWKVLREKAIEKGYIHSYELIEAKVEKDTVFDLVLITRYKDQAQFDRSEENFQKLIKELITDKGGVKLKNELKPNDFRQNVFVKTGKSYIKTQLGEFLSNQVFKETRTTFENDGWKIVGDLSIPESKEKTPAVILLNKAAGNRDIYKNLAQQLWKRGIATFRIDLRAHGESVNKGKFGAPFDEKMRLLLAGSDTDISAAVYFLKNNPKIDANRIGLVGASYSGEEMAVSVRKSGFSAKAFVAFSPGSFSDESINLIDQSKIPWLFIKSVDESSFVTQVFSKIREKSKTAQIFEVSGNKHATDILEVHPEAAEMIAVWFEDKL